ncbi:uncharacterized protein LOC111712474 [Eurytemora carolleeae]|uniref:uncharacterized protein LOC111712474 n=1 Tax=Eurytemora carolleeae TaxID=1294199 RepID=UPI000C784E1C|nr:uncharacterized protein LOC111712474 [Eurytemora carolleeae]|eukprot:XP_023342856.1 uncharacterized protein LOC111712474 [Eurytemora affinis]
MSHEITSTVPLKFFDSGFYNKRSKCFSTVGRMKISAPTNDEAFGFMFYVKLQNSSNQKQNGVTFTSDGISISVIDENMNFYASGKSSLSHLPRGTYNQISVDKQTVDRTNEWKFYQTRQCTLIEDECNWMRCQMNVVRTEMRRSLGCYPVYYGRNSTALNYCSPEIHNSLYTSDKIRSIGS